VSAFHPAIARRAILYSFLKLDPRERWRKPVIFVVTEPRSSVRFDPDEPPALAVPEEISPPEALEMLAEVRRREPQPV
jgi:hypothetical protein